MLLLLLPMATVAVRGYGVGNRGSRKFANELHEPLCKSGPLRLQASQESWRVKTRPPLLTPPPPPLWEVVVGMIRRSPFTHFIC